MNKLMISGLEGRASGVNVIAQYNPKELGVEQVIAWRTVKWEGPDLDSAMAAPKTMSFELMFDSLESGTPIQDTVVTLLTLTNIDAALKRPSRVKVAWGTNGASDVMPAFEGVIESIGVKYTMFDGDGVPLRATISLRLIEARKVTVTGKRATPGRRR